MAEIDAILRTMVERRASDLHLSAGEPIRLRIHGHLDPLDERRLNHDDLVRLMEPICRPDLWRRFREHGDLDFAYGLAGVSRFRCNYLEQARGIGAVFRVIPEEIISLATLNLPEAINRFHQFRKGLVLVTGPTGSGKSTTLAAVIDAINEQQCRHIVTIEDPIEFVHRSKKSFVVQREVGMHAVDFSQALKDAIRSDPDVVLMGEMRDLQTVELAVSAAEMGVLVFGTLHTNSAPKTIDRLIDVFPPDQQEQIRGMLASSLRGIAAQQLLRRADGKGRVVASEILISGPGLANIIREGSVSKIYTFMQANRALGMQTMDEALQRHVEAKTVSIQDAYLKATNKQEFERWLQQKGYPLEL